MIFRGPSPASQPRTPRSPPRDPPFLSKGAAIAATYKHIAAAHSTASSASDASDRPPTPLSNHSTPKDRRNGPRPIFATRRLHREQASRYDVSFLAVPRFLRRLELALGASCTSKGAAPTDSQRSETSGQTWARAYMWWFHATKAFHHTRPSHFLFFFGGEPLFPPLPGNNNKHNNNHNNTLQAPATDASRATASKESFRWVSIGSVVFVPVCPCYFFFLTFAARFAFAPALSARVC
jgi:hypothetical protein